MRIILALLFSTSVAIIAAVSFANGANQQEEWKERIDAVCSTIAQPDAPGLAVLVKHQGRVLFEKAYGVRELRTGTKNTPDTNFRLASCTKQFTAMATMLLVHDGKLRYDDRLTDIFPEFPAYGKAITVRHLLTHTSGLPDYEALMEKEEKARGHAIWSPEHQIQDEEVLRLLAQASAGKFAPGASWAYSNSGYVVLGLVIAKVSSMRYGDFLQTRVFAPAGMNHSVVYQRGIHEVSNRALGYSLENGKWAETDQSSTSATLGDGGVYSNIQDLANWDQALDKHTLLSEQDMGPALVPVKRNDGSDTRWPTEPGEDNPAPGKPVSYGFGWYLDPYQGRARMWHSGATMGFRTAIERFPADQLTIVILSNRANLDSEALSDEIAGAVLHELR